MRIFPDIAALKHAAAAGDTALGVSGWVTVDQAMIDRFAEATGDFQWIHVDVARAKASPFGGTIAHGFLTLSLIPMLNQQISHINNVRNGINYGCNKVRFTSPVPADSRVQGRFVLSRVEEVTGGLQLTFVVTVAIEGQQKPALIADSLVRRFFKK